MTAPTPAPPAPIRIGALAPLSPPGWTEAGRHLVAGMELAVAEINADGGIAGRPLELLVRDTAADPARAEAAVDDLDRLGVAALAGEYHSVVARAVAAKAAALRLPFLCASAVLDALVDAPTDFVARIAPPQSRGWRVYADFLAAAGHARIAVAAQPSLYWASGTRILARHLEARGGSLVALPTLEPAGVRDALTASGATALLILAGHPEPALSIAAAVRADARLAHVLVGAPAGQPEFAEWARPATAGIPFLRYLPERLPPLGTRVAAALQGRLGAMPSFVAFEGYDTIVVLAALLRRHGPDRARISAGFADVAAEGTRGTVRFAKTAETGIWQWNEAPVAVADRDPADPGRLRRLHAG